MTGPTSSPTGGDSRLPNALSGEAVGATGRRSPRVFLCVVAPQNGIRWTVIICTIHSCLVNTRVPHEGAGQGRAASSSILTVCVVKCPTNSSKAHLLQANQTKFIKCKIKNSLSHSFFDRKSSVIYAARTEYRSKDDAILEMAVKFWLHSVEP